MYCLANPACKQLNKNPVARKTIVSWMQCDSRNASQLLLAKLSCPACFLRFSYYPNPNPTDEIILPSSSAD